MLANPLHKIATTQRHLYIPSIYRVWQVKQTTKDNTIVALVSVYY